MRKKIYILGMFLGSLTLVQATEVLVRSTANSEAGLTVEWIGLIILALTGFIFIWRSAQQIKKIKKLQNELDTYQTTVASELDTIGGKDA